MHAVLRSLHEVQLEGHVELAEFAAVHLPLLIRRQIVPLLIIVVQRNFDIGRIRQILTLLPLSCLAVIIILSIGVLVDAGLVSLTLVRLVRLVCKLALMTRRCLNLALSMTCVILVRRIIVHLVVSAIIKTIILINLLIPLRKLCLQRLSFVLQLRDLVLQGFDFLLVADDVVLRRRQLLN